MSIFIDKREMELWGVDSEAEDLLIVDLILRAQMDRDKGSVLISQLNEYDFGRPSNRCCYSALRIFYDNNHDFKIDSFIAQAAHIWMNRTKSNNIDAIRHISHHIGSIANESLTVEYSTLERREEEIGIQGAIAEPLIEAETCLARIKHMTRHRRVKWLAESIINASLKNEPVGRYNDQLQKLIVKNTKHMNQRKVTV